MSKVRAAILGASGYSGAELVRALLKHPRVQLVAVGGDSSAGESVASLYPALRSLTDLKFEKLDAAGLKGRADIVFLALPHTQSMAHAPGILEAGMKVIDLSGDFRLQDGAAYKAFYKHDAASAELRAKAVYGLPELHKSAIAKASLVANPGCYTTTSILGLAPLLAAKKVKLDSLLIDAKSGVSGAGRKLSAGTQFVQDYDDFSAYKVGGVHQHIPEIEQELGALAGQSVTVTFTPHLLPLTRGILATCYASLSAPATVEELLKLYTDFYAQAPFVRVYPAGELPSLRASRGTNYCDIGLSVDARAGRVIVVSCTDNLGKGAAFQAVQNMNLMMGWDETEGLDALSALAV